MSVTWSSPAAILFGGISERLLFQPILILPVTGKEILSFTSLNKQHSEMADEVETFLKYVLERSEEINGGAHHESRGENFLNVLLLHVDLLGNTVQFLHEIGNISSFSRFAITTAMDHEPPSYKCMMSIYMP